MKWALQYFLMGLALASGSAIHARHHVRARVEHVATSPSDYYTAASGHRVHRPIVADRPPAGASAQCRDRSWSFSESRRGTCSHHGGVARWL